MPMEMVVKGIWQRTIKLRNHARWINRLTTTISQQWLSLTLLHVCALLCSYTIPFNYWWCIIQCMYRKYCQHTFHIRCHDIWCCLFLWSWVHAPLNPLTCTSHYSGFYVITVQTFAWYFLYSISFAFRIHAIGISDTSFVQLQRRMFNTNGVTGRRKFSYTELHKVNTEKRRKTLYLFYDKNGG